MLIEQIIRDFESNEKPRLNKLKRYYKGDHDIKNTVKDKNKPNYKLVNNFEKNIVSNTVGYWMGKPVISSTEDKDLSEIIKNIEKYNDIHYLNTALAVDLSVYGRAIEIIYLDEDKNIRISKLDVENTYIKFKDTLEKEIEYAIRWYDVKESPDATHLTRYIELYDNKEVHYYKKQENLVHLKSVSHNFKMCPVNVYFNNEDQQGDFESVISLIDAYDVMQSESLNDYSTFADAYLALSGIDINAEDAAKLRENRLLILNENGNANWLVKQTNDQYIENIKNRLNNDIYTFSNTVNMSDKEFANNDSGIAIAYKLLNFENRVAQTEGMFKKGLLRRWELICNMLNVKGGNYDFTSITFTFVRNLPADIAAISLMTMQLSGIVSKKTLLKQIPFVEDVETELINLKEEAGEYNEDLNGDENDKQ